MSFDKKGKSQQTTGGATPQSLWETKEIIGEVAKNKSATIKISRTVFHADSGDQEYIKIQTWKLGEDGETSFPDKNSAITMKPAVAEKLAEVLAKI